MKKIPISICLLLAIATGCVSTNNSESESQDTNNITGTIRRKALDVDEYELSLNGSPKGIKTGARLRLRFLVNGQRRSTAGTSYQSNRLEYNFRSGFQAQGVQGLTLYLFFDEDGDNNPDRGGLGAIIKVDDLEELVNGIEFGWENVDLLAEYGNQNIPEQISVKVDVAEQEKQEAAWDGRFELISERSVTPRVFRITLTDNMDMSLISGQIVLDTIKYQKKAFTEIVKTESGKSTYDIESYQNLTGGSQGHYLIYIDANENGIVDDGEWGAKLYRYSGTDFSFSELKQNQCIYPHLLDPPGYDYGQIDKPLPPEAFLEYEGKSEIIFHDANYRGPLYFHKDLTLDDFIALFQKEPDKKNTKSNGDVSYHFTFGEKDSLFLSFNSQGELWMLYADSTEQITLYGYPHFPWDFSSFREYFGGHEGSENGIFVYNGRIPGLRFHVNDSQITGLRAWLFNPESTQ